MTGLAGVSDRTSMTRGKQFAKQIDKNVTINYEPVGAGYDLCMYVYGHLRRSSLYDNVIRLPNLARHTLPAVCRYISEPHLAEDEGNCVEVHSGFMTDKTRDTISRTPYHMPSSRPPTCHSCCDRSSEKHLSN